jgi:hypothetical protein
VARLIDDMPFGRKRAIKASRVTVISEEIQCMADKGMYDWFSQATQGRTAKLAKQALRVLLAED